ncbi:hypothetical protein, partial [Aeromonas salmonicida]|uniref:hypothetical protein n=1 Tax=Aeromonas salmonicida TaxID=645 RepID=UPI00223F36F2
SQSYIDFDKIKSEMNSNFCNKRFDVVACDFNFANDDLNGYTLLQWLINESNSKKLKIRFAKFYCYSAEQDKFTAHLLTNEKIIRIIKLKLDGFYNRATLADELTSELLKIHRYFSLEKHILSLLQRNPDKVFNYIFPKYKGKSFSHIVNEIEKGTDTGYEFQQFFLDLTHAHIMNLNKD